MQIIRTLGKLGYCDRELASDLIIGIVFQIEVARCGYEAHETVILIRIEHCLQVEAIFPVFVSLVEFGRVKGIPLIDRDYFLALAQSNPSFPLTILWIYAVGVVD